MLCPRCQVNLQMMDRQGIEVDYCPNCRGVWLDRGELDKVIERSAMPTSQQGYNQPGYPPPPQPGYPPVQGQYYNQPPYRRDDDDDDWDDDDDYHKRYRGQPGYNPNYRKRKGFLGDLFDF
jgi:uncharacterized protein